MYAIYGNIYHQYTPNLSIYIPYMDPMGIGTKEKCAELEEAWNSCADTAELLKEEVAEAVHGDPPVSTNV